MLTKHCLNIVKALYKTVFKCLNGHTILSLLVQKLRKVLVNMYFFPSFEAKLLQSLSDLMGT